MIPYYNALPRGQGHGKFDKPVNNNLKWHLWNHWVKFDKNLPGMILASLYKICLKKKVDQPKTLAAMATERKIFENYFL